MPIYAYRCDSCGQENDVLQKMSDALLTICPACHMETYSKQLAAPGFHLKGSGWYATDFKGGASSVSKSESSAESGGETKTDVKTDSKPESKTDSKPESKTESKTESLSSQ